MKKTLIRKRKSKRKVAKVTVMKDGLGGVVEVAGAMTISEGDHQNDDSLKRKRSVKRKYLVPPQFDVHPENITSKISVGVSLKVFFLSQF